MTLAYFPDLTSAPSRMVPLAPNSAGSPRSSLSYSVGSSAVYVPDDDEADGDVRAYVSRLWAEDWDCEDDAIYDDL